MTLDRTDFERRLEQLLPEPLDIAHRTATLARSDAVSPIRVRRSLLASDARRLVAAAVTVFILVVLREVALTSLADTTRGSVHGYTRTVERWAKYVQRIHTLDVMPTDDAMPEREAPPIEVDGPQASRAWRANRWV